MLVYCTAHVKVLGRIARNRPVREPRGPPPIDRRRLANDLHLRQEVATVTGEHPRAFPPSGSSVDDVETPFTTPILQTAERVAPPRAPRLPGRGWRGDARAEAVISMAMSARRAAWKRQRADTQGSQLMRAARRENTRVDRVCDDAYKMFLERQFQGMEEDLRQHDRRGIFQRLKSLNIENTRKVSSKYIRDEEGMMLRDSGLVLGRWARFFGTPLNAKIRSSQTRHHRRPPLVAYHTRSRGRTGRKRVNRSLEVDGKREGSGIRRTPCLNSPNSG